MTVSYMTIMADQLNAVDLLVREMMLTHPMLYRDRQSALKEMFFNSSYEWQDGGIVNRYPSGKTFDGRIDLSDLERRDGITNDDLAEFFRLEDEQERQARLFRAEHIDLYCRFSGRGEFRHYEYGDLDDYQFDSQYTALAAAPYGSIKPEWAAAIEEFVSNVMLAYNHVFGIHHDKPLPGDKVPEPSMFSRMPERFQRYFRAIEAVGEKIEHQTGNLARQAAWWEANKESIMGELRD